MIQTHDLEEKMSGLTVKADNETGREEKE